MGWGLSASSILTCDANLIGPSVAHLLVRTCEMKKKSAELLPSEVEIECLLQGALKAARRES